MEHEPSTAGSVASTEESAKICEILPVPPAESGQCSAIHYRSSAQGSEHILALLGASPGEGDDQHYIQQQREGGRSQGAPVLPADLSHSTAQPWPCHVPQGHQWGPTGTATCSTSGCPALPSLSPPWAVKVTGLPYFCSEGVSLLLLSTASYCALSLIKDLLSKCTSSNGDSLKFEKYYLTLKGERSAVTGRSERLERRGMAMVSGGTGQGRAPTARKMSRETRLL